MEYETLRNMADSWGLVFLTAVFVFVVLFSFRRGSRQQYRDAANIPLRDADRSGPLDGPHNKDDNREVPRDH